MNVKILALKRLADILGVDAKDFFLLVKVVVQFEIMDCGLSLIADFQA